MPLTSLHRPGEAGEPAVEARRVPAAVAPPPGEFSYVVVPDKPRPAAGAGDKRTTARQRTRLRSGKIIDPQGGFLTECLLTDRSARGGRLRLPPAFALPAWIGVFDDQSGELFQAEVVWRRGGEAGIRFHPFESTPHSRAVAADMRRRYYKVRD